jgi:tetratricopeptide (TPR) repeat protein
LAPSAADLDEASPLRVVPASAQTLFSAAFGGERAQLTDNARVSRVALERRVVRVVVQPIDVDAEADPPSAELRLVDPARATGRCVGVLCAERAAGFEGPWQPPEAVVQAVFARLGELQDRFAWQEVAPRPTADPPPGPRGAADEVDAALRAISELRTQGNPEAADAKLQTLFERARKEAAMAPGSRLRVGLAALSARGRADKAATELVDAALQGLAASSSAAADAAARARIARDVAAGQLALGRYDAADETLAACDGLAATGRRPCLRWTHVWTVLGQRQRDEAAERWAARAADALLQGTPEAERTEDDLAQRAAVAMQLADHEGERRWAEAGVERFPRSVPLLMLLAGSAFRNERYAEAIRLYRRVHKEAPNHPNLFGHIAGAYNRLRAGVRDGEIDGAELTAIDAELAKARADGDLLARFLDAVAAFYDARFEEAIERFAALEADLGHEARVYVYMAMAHHWLGHVEESRALSAKAVEVGPLDPDVYYVRSHVWRRDDIERGAEDLRRYVRLSEAPGSIEFPDKTERVRKELAALERGELPPDWDRPGGANADALMPLWGWLVLALLALGMVLVSVARVRRSSSIAG